MKTIIITILFTQISYLCKSQVNQTSQLDYLEYYSSCLDSALCDKQIIELMKDTSTRDFPRVFGGYYKCTFLDFLILNAFSDVKSVDKTDSLKLCFIRSILTFKNIDKSINDPYVLSLLYFCKRNTEKLSIIGSKNPEVNKLIESLNFSIEVLDINLVKDTSELTTQIDTLFSTCSKLETRSNYYFTNIPIYTIAYKWYVANKTHFELNFVKMVQRFGFDTNPYVIRLKFLIDKYVNNGIEINGIPSYIFYYAIYLNLWQNN